MLLEYKYFATLVQVLSARWDSLVQLVIVGWWDPLVTQDLRDRLGSLVMWVILALLDGEVMSDRLETPERADGKDNRESLDQLEHLDCLELLVLQVLYCRSLSYYTLCLWSWSSLLFFTITESLLLHRSPVEILSLIHI